MSTVVAAQQGLEADTSQLPVPESGSILASIPWGLAKPVSGWLAQLKPDPLGGSDVPLHQVVATILCLVFATLALLHLYWAAGGSRAVQGAVPTVGDRPLFSPGPLATLAVAAALIAATAIAAERGGLLSLALPAWLSHLGTWVLVLAFGLRAMGEFQYVGFFKRVRGTVFARRDTLIYSPLCAFISALAAGLAVLAP